MALRLLMLTVAAMSMARLAGATALTEILARLDTSATACVALVLPRVQGVEGSAEDVAAGVRDIFAKYLNGPSIRTIVVEARLMSQAMQEVRQKDCAHVLTVTLTRKRGGGMLKRALAQGAGSAAVYLPGGGVGSAVARVAAIGGAQAMATMAASTRAKDEIQLEYAVATVDGSALLPQASDKAKAQADGEDIVTPLVERAATAIAAALGLK